LLSFSLTGNPGFPPSDPDFGLPVAENSCLYVLKVNLMWNLIVNIKSIDTSIPILVLCFYRITFVIHRAAGMHIFRAKAHPAVSADLPPTGSAVRKVQSTVLKTSFPASLPQLTRQGISVLLRYSAATRHSDF